MTEPPIIIKIVHILLGVLQTLIISMASLGTIVIHNGSF